MWQRPIGPPYFRVRAVLEGVVEADEIDQATRHGTGVTDDHGNSMTTCNEPEVGESVDECQVRGSHGVQVAHQDHAGVGRQDASHLSAELIDRARLKTSGELDDQFPASVPRVFGHSRTELQAPSMFASSVLTCHMTVQVRETDRSRDSCPMR